MREATYERFKPFESEGISNIPAHWDPIRLRFLIRSNPLGSEVKLAGDQPVSFIPMEAVGEYGGLTLDTEKPLDDIGSGYTYFAENDVIVAKITPCFENGKGALAQGLTNGIAFGTTELHVLRALDELDSRFLFYLTISDWFRKLGEAHMYGAGGQKRVPERFIKEFRPPLPPTNEQQAIVSFLDEKTTKIDALIAKKAELLKRLAEKRTALITQAVTKGLNLDAPMKPSGVEWLGDIPENWDMVHLQRLFTVKSGDMISAGNMVDEGYPVFGGNGFRGFYEQWNTPENTILIGRYGALCGNVHIVREKVWATEHAFRVFPFMDFNTDFMAFVIETLGLNDFSKRSAQPGLNSRIVRDNRCGFPPLNEQEQIVNYLKCSFQRLDALKEPLKAQIERLHEYRQALITAAVTGQVDVREGQRERVAV